MWKVNEHEHDATALKVAKINERAQKRGFTGRIELKSERVTRTFTDEFGLERTEIWYEVSLVGEPPCYNGWTFLATLDWDEHAGLVVRSVPGAPMVDRSLLQENHCDHCASRRHRKATYVIRNEETGQQLQVGSTCIKDFLGWSTSIVFFSEEDLTSELGLGGFGEGCTSVGTDYALAVAWALIKLDGYRPASSQGWTTKGDAMDVLFPPRTMPQEQRDRLARIRSLAAEAKERAAECRAWVLSDKFIGESDYVRNLRAILRADEVSSRNIGILVSAPQAWARYQERSLIHQEKPSEWLGTVQEKVKFTAVITAIRFIPGQFQTVVLYSMQDKDGNRIKWFASREALGDAVGKEVTLIATIKDLVTFQGVKETIVTRAKSVAA